jgi:hypothetical protein
VLHLYLSIAERIGITAATRLRKDEREKAIIAFLGTDRPPLPKKRTLHRTGVKDIKHDLHLKLRIKHLQRSRAAVHCAEQEAAIRKVPHRR